MQIDQAIFTSARTEHGDGYQLVARSPGVTADQARELAVWGPSHDALYSRSDEPFSVNFHRLTCGTFCVSKTVAAGDEYSSRGGARIYTQFLLISPADLARFANNPFAVLRAACAKGILAVLENPPATLEPFTLAGRSPAVDNGLLTQFVSQIEHDCVGRLINAALVTDVQLIAGMTDYEMLFGGLLNCFPVECRTELTFTTGLRYSPRRPFHLAPLSGDAAEKRRADRYEGATLVDLSTSSNEGKAELGGWAAYVAEVIRRDQLPRLATELQQARPGLSLAGLNDLGEQLLNTLGAETATVASESDGQVESHMPAQSTSNSQRMFRKDRPNCRKRVDSQQGLSTSVRDELSTARKSRNMFIETANLPADISGDPRLLRLFEQLDSAVSDAVEGVPTALDEARLLWTQMAAGLDPQSLSAVREECLRHALLLWHACESESRQPQRAIDTLDLLDVLFAAE